MTTINSPSKQSVKLVGINKNKVMSNSKNTGLNICKPSNSLTINDSEECYEPSVGIEKSDS